MSAFTTLLYRAWRISHNYMAFHIELGMIRTLFLNNGYPDKIIFNNIRNFITQMYKEKPVILTAPNEIVYVALPFLNNDICSYVKKSLRDINNKYFPQVNIRCAFINNFKLRNFTNHKDKLSPLWCSDVVYKYTCAVCGNCYIGSTNRSLAIRISEHQGKSFRKTVSS